MTRALYDLQQQVFNDYTYTNIAGAAVENHTAKPEIAIRSTFERLTPANNSNGKIIFETAKPANNIEFGQSRHKVWFAEGYIEHQNKTIFDDATIMAMKAEIERVLNIYNATIGSYTYLFVTDEGWNTDPITPIYDFTIEITEYGVTAIA